ncbi:MAG: ABC transporter ATP-binding protein [Phycisphaeraceae bacterium]|nr:ABC transporter ATP-binding protein [Phycisphaeraceae bacterium]MCW5755036.1 ABC transporter ATP-binding protein [Phycisphaeraceae bacterium]
MIEIKNVTKKFGNLCAVDDLSIEIGAGELYGFIGPNGAGKSTTMKILACLLRPDRGSARVCGHDVRTDGDEIRRVLGYMPDYLGVYDDLTVDEYLQFFASAFRIARTKRRGLIDEVLKLTDLSEKRRAMVSSLSRGMTQRLGVARVLLHDPKVLLLDEPASGLDPRARIEMRELLVELRRMGKCLMVSSHILSELAEMSTSIGIIERGKLLYTGSIEDAYERVRGGERITITLEAPPEAADGAAWLSPERAAEVLRADPRVTRSESEDGKVHVELSVGEKSHHFVIESLVRAGARIAAFEPKGVKLEDAFLKLTKGAVQ